MTRTKDDRTELICVPHAGAAAARYRWLDRPLADLCRVVAVELPGRGARRGEALVRTTTEGVERLLDSIGDRLPERYLLFGHSLGALLAFELARTLQAADRPPVALLVSGRNGPRMVPPCPPLHHLPDAELGRALRDFGGMPRELLDDDALLALTLPELRADLEISEGYLVSPGAPLRCPITALVATDDPMANPAGVHTWSRETTGPFRMVVHPGGHFAVTGEPIVPLLRDEVAALLTSTAPSSPLGAGR